MGKEEIIKTITAKLQDMYLAELVQVSDFVRGIELARKFYNR